MQGNGSNIRDYQKKVRCTFCGFHSPRGVTAKDTNTHSHAGEEETGSALRWLFLDVSWWGASLHLSSATLNTFPSATKGATNAGLNILFRVCP